MCCPATICVVQRPVVLSNDQLCLSATIWAPRGTIVVKVISHNPMGIIRAYKYKHSTTSVRSTRPLRVSHDRECIPHDQCGFTRPVWIHTTSVDSHDQMLRSTRPYTAESSLEKIHGFPNLSRCSQQQTLTISATEEIFIPTEESLPSI